MANTKQAKKRARQAEKARIANHSKKSTMRTLVKKVLQAIESKNQTLALEEYQKTSSMIDNLARKGIIHKNKAARHKSRLTAKIKAIAA